MTLEQLKLKTLNDNPYGKAPSTINEHIGDIFDDKELLPEACRKKFGNSEFQQKAPY